MVHKLASVGAKNPPQGTQSLQRVSSLLRVIASHNRLGLRVVDICKLTDLQRPTVHRMLQCLLSEHLLIRNAKTHNYQLGQLVYELGLTAASTFQLKALCAPHLAHLVRMTNNSAFLTVRSGYDAVCIDRKEGGLRLRSYTVIGTRRPLGIGAGGLAILARLNKQKIREILTFNARHLRDFYRIDVAELGRSINRAKIRGYAVHDAPESGARALGVALHDEDGNPVAAISISSAKKLMSAKHRVEIAALISAEISEIERTLQEPGYFASTTGKKA